ncbi:MAG: hypothetical protein PUD59_04460 [bacterium]|nr:hypothetical protein [bacterium]
MQKIVEYNKIYLNRFSLRKIWICLIIILTLMIIILDNVNYEKYYANNASVVDDNVLKVFVNKDDLSILNKYNKIKIDNDFFAYTIIKIDEIEYINKKYFEVLLKIKLDEKHNIINNYINFKILLERQCVLKYIINKLGV